MSQPRTETNLAEYLTVGEAAKLLGVSAWTLRNWDKAGKLKSRRHPINRHRLYRHEDLTAVLESLRTGPAGRLAPYFDWDQAGDTDHLVQFYESSTFLVES